jgi:hypothetical protein
MSSRGRVDFLSQRSDRFRNVGSLCDGRHDGYTVRSLFNRLIDVGFIDAPHDCEGYFYSLLDGSNRMGT